MTSHISFSPDVIYICLLFPVRWQSQAQPLEEFDMLWRLVSVHQKIFMRWIRIRIICTVWIVLTTTPRGVTRSRLAIKKISVKQ